MGRLIAIEGLDGAGKRTLADDLARALTSLGATVGRLAFPRYGQDVHADIVGEVLHGGHPAHGDLADSVYGMALLYALDRRSAIARLRVLTAEHDVLLLDRYVASNAAYGAARLHQDADGAFVAWVHALEIERFAIPSPDVQLLLRVPVELAATRAARREQDEPSRARDAFESNDDLQLRCARVYDGLVASGWLAPWRVVDGRGGHPGGGSGDNESRVELARWILSQRADPAPDPAGGR